MNPQPSKRTKVLFLCIVAVLTTVGITALVIALCTSDNESRHSLTIAMSCISLADILFLVKIARDRRSRQQ